MVYAVKLIESKPYLIEFPVWTYLIHVTFTNDPSASALKRDPRFGSSDHCAALTCSVKSQPVTHIYVKRTAPIPTIVHECWHAIRRMFVYCGADLEDECVAYHLDHLVGEILRLRKKKGRKN